MYWFARSPLKQVRDRLHPLPRVGCLFQHGEFMYTGSCLCGQVRYRIDAEITEVACCHCRECRKVQGTAFATNAPVKAADFQLESGRDLIREYESSTGKFRAFCSSCGSPVYSRKTDLPEILRLRIGSLDTPMQHKPDYHIFADDKAEWYDIHDGQPQYSGFKP